ncbi:MAG TPA: TrkA family potassium uptake protein, partial [Actinopolymorphaceae bacterium]|nr:TrkA family potassium uptake protein [Actinopolymorphaceae bacterium]
AGVGRLGAQVAHVLSAAGSELTVVDQDEERLAEVAAHLDARALPGDACEPSILEEAGAHVADLLIAATGDDEDNLVISLLAKRQFAVPRVVARVNDPDNAWLFDERWGVDVSVPSAVPLVSLIEEATGATDTVALLRLARAGVTVIETAIADTSRAAGHRLAEIDLPSGSIVATVVRRGRPTVPDADLRLEPGDELLVVSAQATEQDVHAAFQ